MSFLMLNQSALHSVFTKIIALLIFSLSLTACGGGGSKGVNPPPHSARFSYVKMHNGLLKNQPYDWNENISLQNIILSNYAAKGSTVLNVKSNADLVVNQLITYKSTDGNYYIGKISALPTNQIKLTSPLEDAISAGNNAWDLYSDSTPHPNIYGYKAIADFSVRSLGFGSSTGGTHLLLGDSWFDGGDIARRLRQKLSGATIINKGIGGNTAKDLINRFDQDVTPHSPDYVWILCGTNDYWQGVSTAQFKANLNTLINKSKAIGAKVIIFDSSVGAGTGSTGVSNQHQSEEYVRVLQELL